MVEMGHFPSWPLMEIRKPCISSSQTLSTVPAFPSVRITALPTSSVWACSSSPRIVDARTLTVGMGYPESEFKRVGGCIERCASLDRRAANECQWNPTRNFGERKTRALKCRSCGTRPVHMIRLTQTRAIAPYVWVHTDDGEQRIVIAR